MHREPFHTVHHLYNIDRSLPSKIQQDTEVFSVVKALISQTFKLGCDLIGLSRSRSLSKAYDFPTRDLISFHHNH